ncbi:MAG: GDP-mannose 4,6-dehydratase [Thermoanaerobaculia bacterium]|nr:GDP-mannose 4,6-dehydratase [Thermoanaerobaculia bacterium]
MRVLVTGVSGFVGERLAARLLATGHEVWGSYIHEPPELAGVELVEADVRDRAALGAAFAASEPDAVVHLAGLTHVGESWERQEEYFAVNVEGTRNVLAAAAGRRVVVASSAEVYGVVPEDEQPIPEDRPVAPQSPYARTKAAAEELAAQHGAAVVRSFNLAGAGQAPTFALPSFARQLAEIGRGEREPVLAVGNLAARRDFLHVDDGAAGYQTVLERGEARPYNLGSGAAVSIGEALRMLIGVSGLAVSTREDPARWRPVDLPVLTADCTRLRGLGWAPERGLRQALEELWAAAASG